MSPGGLHRVCCCPPWWDPTGTLDPCIALEPFVFPAKMWVMLFDEIHETEIKSGMIPGLDTAPTGGRWLLPAAFDRIVAPDDYVTKYVLLELDCPVNCVQARDAFLPHLHGENTIKGTAAWATYTSGCVTLTLGCAWVRFGPGSVCVDYGCDPWCDVNQNGGWWWFIPATWATLIIKFKYNGITYPVTLRSYHLLARVPGSYTDDHVLTASDLNALANACEEHEAPICGGGGSCADPFLCGPFLEGDAGKQTWPPSAPNLLYASSGHLLVPTLESYIGANGFEWGLLTNAAWQFGFDWYGADHEPYWYSGTFWGSEDPVVHWSSMPSQIGRTYSTCGDYTAYGQLILDYYTPTVFFGAYLGRHFVRILPALPALGLTPSGCNGETEIRYEWTPD